jgi:hypothetical protein
MAIVIRVILGQTGLLTKVAHIFYSMPIILLTGTHGEKMLFKEPRKKTSLYFLA